MNKSQEKQRLANMEDASFKVLKDAVQGSDENKSKIIHEKLFGECWHRWRKKIIKLEARWICVECDDDGGFAEQGDPPMCPNPDYTKPEMFITLWEKLKEQEWFEDFIKSRNNDLRGDVIIIGRFLRKVIQVNIDLINPQRLVDLICEYLEEVEG